MRDVISYPFPFSVVFRAWMNNYITLFYVNIITYTCRTPDPGLPNNFHDFNVAASKKVISFVVIPLSLLVKSCNFVTNMFLWKRNCLPCVFMWYLAMQLMCQIKFTTYTSTHIILKPSPFSAWTWWRHQMETFSALLALCAGISPISGEFPAQRPVTRSFDIFFDLRLNKRLRLLIWDAIVAIMTSSNGSIFCVTVEMLVIWDATALIMMSL